VGSEAATTVMALRTAFAPAGTLTTQGQPAVVQMTPTVDYSTAPPSTGIPSWAWVAGGVGALALIVAAFAAKR